jgi:DNA-binding transcriptional regulator YiaG
LTQAAFAELIGVAPNTVARWERGELGIKNTSARLMRLLVAQEQKGRGKR